MDRGRQGIPSWRRSAALLGLSTVLSSIAVIGTAVDVAATDPCTTNAPNPYSAGPYQNPLRGATVTPARIDEGVDYTSARGPIYAIGDAGVDMVTNAGWPNHVFIAYHLCNGPAAHKEVYVAECVTVATAVGRFVNSYTQLGTLKSCNDPTWCPNFDCGIETGWADPSSIGQSMAKKYGQEPSGGGAGTAFGSSFNHLLLGLGAKGGSSYPAGGLCGSGLTTPACLPLNWPNAHNLDPSRHAGFYNSASCPSKTNTTSLLAQKVNTFSVYAQGTQYLGDEYVTLTVWKHVASDSTWCFDEQASLSWVSGAQPPPRAAFEIDIALNCSHATQSVGWAFEKPSTSYTISSLWTNTGWSTDAGSCLTSWGVNNAVGSYGSQVEDQWGDKFNYGTPSSQYTFVQYGTM